MSKLTKLLRQPGQFVRDSKAYRRLAITKDQVLRGGSPMSTIALGTATERLALRERLLGDLGRSVPALDLTEGSWPRIAVLREDAHHLSAYLHSLGHEAGFEVALRSSKSVLRVAEAKLFTIDDFLCDAREIDATVGAPNGARIPLAIEIWRRDAGEIVGPRANVVVRRIPERTAEELGLFQAGSLRHARDLLGCPLETDVELPVDAVYTWVNHRDPGWRALWKQVVGSLPEDQDDDTRGLDRFMNRDELKYSLRSVAEYAPWLRRIFVVSNCAPPDWLDVEHAKITWVDHRKIIPPEHLPTFSSHAIESRLHHVPGLAEHFLYFNDDFFLLRPTAASDFFEATGMSKSFLEEYGSVHGDVRSEDPDYLNAARNGRRLLEDTLGRTATALHKHTPYALRRDVLQEMEERFREPIAQTTSNRFRASTDISTVSFLYHHYGYLTGRAIPAQSSAMLIKPQTPRYERKLQQLLDAVKPAPISLCLNDGGGSGAYPHWDRHVVEFLEGQFPEKSPYEK